MRGGRKFVRRRSPITPTGFETEVELRFLWFEVVEVGAEGEAIVGLGLNASGRDEIVATPR